MEIIKLTQDVPGSAIRYLKQKFKSLENVYVSNGWIDGHVHIYPKAVYSTPQNIIKKLSGILYMIDAGSSGINNIEDFNDYAKNLYPEIYYWLNISPNGLISKNELKEFKFDLIKHKKVLEHNDRAIGTKIRLSAQATDGDENSISQSIRELKKRKYPIMFHVGNMSSKLRELFISNIKPGDSITHFYNGKNNFIYDLYSSNKLEGIIRDVGWGKESFSFKKYKEFLDINCYPDVISSDMHGERLDQITGLNKCMNYFLNSGMRLENVVKAVTENPYAYYLSKKLKKEDYLKTFTFFTINEVDEELEDSLGTKKIIKKVFRPLATMKKGEIKLC